MDISQEDRELIDSIMEIFQDPAGAKYDALNTFIILQRASSDDLKVINNILKKTINKAQDTRVKYVSLVREDEELNSIITQIQKITPEKTQEQIIRAAVAFMALTRKFSTEDQQAFISLTKKYS